LYYGLQELLGKLSYSGDVLIYEANAFKDRFAAYQLAQMRDARQMPSFVEQIRTEAGGAAAAGGKMRKRDRSGAESTPSVSDEQVKDADLDLLREG